MKLLPNYVRGIGFFIIAYIAINFLSGYLGTEIQNFFLSLPLDKTEKFMILFVFQELIFLFLLYLSLKISKIGKVLTFYKKSFKIISVKNLIKYVFGSFLILVFVMSLIHRLFLKFNINLPGFFGQQEIGTFVENIVFHSNFEIILMFLAIVIIGPFVEELIYRGFVQETLTQNINPKIAVVLSAFIFSFMHFDFSVFGNLFILSFFLCYIYYKTRSLYASLAFHMLINFFTFWMLVMIK